MERLSPRSIFILFVQNIRQFLWPAAASLLPVISAGNKSSRGMPYLVIGLMLGGFGLIAGIAGVITYFRTRYGIVGSDLLVKKGGLFRQDRTIPLSKIHNVTIRQGLMERILKIATVEVETASGAGAEAKLSSVTLAQADILREALLGMSPTAHAASTVEAPTVYTASFKDLALAGALQNRSLYMLAIVLGLFGQGIDDVVQIIIKKTSASGAVEYAEHHPLLSAVIFAVAFALFMLVGWILSILYSVFNFHGFKVIRTAKGLRISYGLVNTMQTLLPIRKVQSVTTNASWLYRMFGVSQISAHSVAGFRPGSEGGERMAAGSTMLAPICRPDTLRTILRLIFPTLELDGLTFHPANPYWIRRSVVGTFLVGAMPTAMFMFVGLVGNRSWMWSLFIPFAILAVAYPFILMAFRNLGYAVKDGMIIIRSGVLSLNVTAIPIANVQSVNLASTYLQRRKKLADVHVCTPASASTIACIDETVAKELAEYIIRHSYGHGRDTI